MNNFIGNPNVKVSSDGDNLVLSCVGELQFNALQVKTLSALGFQILDSSGNIMMDLQNEDYVGLGKDGLGIVILGTSIAVGLPLALEKRLHIGEGANVASATVITLGNDGNYFPITGTTTVTGIVETNWNDGDTIILYSVAGFDITADASPLTGLPIKLVGGSATINAGDIVRLTLADGFWRGRLDNF